MPVFDSHNSNIFISALADIYGQLLTDRQLDFVREYYDYDLSYAEIAQKHGIARQSAKDAVQAARQNLEMWESKLGIHERRQQLKQLTTELESLCKQTQGAQQLIDKLKLL